MCGEEGGNHYDADGSVRRPYGTAGHLGLDAYRLSPNLPVRSGGQEGGSEHGNMRSKRRPGKPRDR